MLLQIYFDVSPDKETAFQSLYSDAYVPAMQKQEGYIRSDLIRIFPPDLAREIEGAETEFNFQMELVFDTEENRRRWVASEEHQVVWPQAEEITNKVSWRGYDLVGEDHPNT